VEGGRGGRGRRGAIGGRLEDSHAARVTERDDPQVQGGGPGGPVGEEIFVIEVAGAGQCPEVSGLPGVVSVRREADRLIVRVAASSSGVVLGNLLAAGEWLRVLRVETAPEAGAGASR